MKVREAVYILRRCNQDAELICASDAEGNALHEVDNIDDPSLIDESSKEAVIIWPSDKEVEILGPETEDEE